MPFWAAIASLLLGGYQAYQASQAQQRAEASAREGGLTSEEIAEFQRRGEESITRDAARRGLLDSGIPAGGRAALQAELAFAKARSRLPLQGSYIQALTNRANQPSLLSSLIPLFLRYGVRGPGGNPIISPVTITQ
jgi:hypothetical protein